MNTDFNYSSVASLIQAAEKNNLPVSALVLSQQAQQIELDEKTVYEKMASNFQVMKECIEPGCDEHLKSTSGLTGGDAFKLRRYSESGKSLTGSFLSGALYRALAVSELNASMGRIVAAPTAGLHFTPRVLDTLKEKGIDLEELTLHVGAGTFKPVKSEEIEGHEMHTEYISVSRGTIEKLIAHDGKATAVGTTSVRTLESLYHIGVTLLKNPDATEEELHVHQWQPYETAEEAANITSVKALQAILDYLNHHNMEALHTSTQIIIAPGYDYKIVCAMVTNFHQPQSTLLLLVSAFVKGNWRKIYDFALGHDFRFLSYGDSSLLIP